MHLPRTCFAHHVDDLLRGRPRTMLPINTMRLPRTAEELAECFSLTLLADALSGSKVRLT